MDTLVDLSKIEVIFFDFGEVLIELDYPLVINSFSKLAHTNAEKIHTLIVNEPSIQQFEVGKISPSEFCYQMNKILSSNISERDFFDIWNLMLKKLPIERIQLLEKLQNKFRTFLLSNSNIVHEKHFNQMVSALTGKKSMEDFVEKAFFSHHIGLRKPDEACYRYAIDEVGVAPHQLLFLDDREDNILAAKSVGMKSVQITNPSVQLVEIFKDIER